MTLSTVKTLFLSALIATATVAVADTYTPIDFPGAISTDASGISSEELRFHSQQGALRREVLQLRA